MIKNKFPRWLEFFNPVSMLNYGAMVISLGYFVFFNPTGSPEIMLGLFFPLFFLFIGIGEGYRRLKNDILPYPKG